MAITRVQKFPSDLPPAHLYLDDIEEITTILTDAVSADDPSDTEPTRVTFELGDLQMDTLEDLEEHEGSAINFEIHVGRRQFRSWRNSVRFFWATNPHVSLSSSGSRDQQLVTYTKIRAVFERRQNTLKNAIRALPDWFKWALWIIFLAGAPQIAEVTHVPHSLYVVVGDWVLLGIVTVWLYFPSRVSFVRSSQRSKSRRQDRKEWSKALALLVIGAAVGKLIEIAITKLWK